MLWIKNGRVIDPANDIDAVLDVLHRRRKHRRVSARPLKSRSNFTEKIAALRTQLLTQRA